LVTEGSDVVLHVGPLQRVSGVFESFEGVDATTCLEHQIKQLGLARCMAIEC
jgi:hypothetical protein